MEVDEEPRNSTDPVGSASPAPDPETELKTAPTAEEGASPNPDGVGCPAIMLAEDGPSSGEEGQKDSPHREQVGGAGVEGESVPVGDTVEPREMDATPATTPPTLAASPEVEERIPIAEYHELTPEGYETPTGVLSATGSPTRPRASPKLRKQLSSPEGSEIAAGLVSAVKRHCGSESELVLSPRLPGRMPYGLRSCLDGKGLESVGKMESRSSMFERDEDPRTPPSTPTRAVLSSDASQEEEPEDLVFAMPPEENKSSGTLTNSPAADREDANGNFLGPLDELAASPSHSATVRSPAGATLSLPAGQETSEGAISPSVRSEGEPPTGSEPAAVSTRPSSPERTVRRYRRFSSLNP